ncbi:MAG: hypothetical protein IIV79_04090, partial [Clostridia bacterium]|nr:hypothetical protein [Clostridia bacterium]
ACNKVAYKLLARIGFDPFKKFRLEKIHVFVFGNGRKFFAIPIYPQTVLHNTSDTVSNYTLFQGENQLMAK